ncbi:MAG: YceH family protein [Leucothrix sp.]
MSDVSNEFHVDAPEAPLPELTAKQVRVFACLIEKHLATPNSYPLTYHSLMTACNQKTNRQPVMALTEGEVGHTSNELVDLGLARIEHGNRANKVTHLAMRALNMTRDDIAVLSILMLREPLTLSEIKARTEKMVSFDSIEKVQETVSALLNRQYPALVLLAKGPGRREDRYSHTLCGEVDIDAFSFSDSAPSTSRGGLSADSEAMQRIEALEARVASLEQMLEDLTT